MIDTYLLSPSFWLLACLGLLLTGVSKSGFAGGAGVLAVPLLALIMPVTEAVVLCLPLLIVMDAKAVHYYFADTHWRSLKKLSPAAAVGIALGSVMFGLLPDRALQLALGTFCLLFACWSALSRRLSCLSGAAGLWGGLSGLSSTLLHAGGPPLNIYLMNAALPKRQWLATAALFFAGMNLVKIVPYTVNDQWQIELLLLTVLLVPVAIAGVWLGHFLQQRLSENRFLLACRILLFCSGAALVVKAIAAYGSSYRSI